MLMQEVVFTSVDDILVLANSNTSIFQYMTDD